MIVCLCHRVSDRTIQGCIDRGARTLDEVGASCGAGTDCGGCRGEIESMLDEARDSASGARRLPVLDENAA
jgi:bacterioferritin-associated ferredoxin